MRIMRRAALAASATIAVAFLAACSDSATAPTATRSAFVPKSSFVVAVGDPTTSLAEVGPDEGLQDRKPPAERSWSRCRLAKGVPAVARPRRR